MSNLVNEIGVRKDFLLCVDSDGCAIDTMEVKHVKCFGPCMVDVWGLQQWEEEILNRWNVINLYSMTRGINRFKGLLRALQEIDKKYTKIEGLEAFYDWCEITPQLSNKSLEEEISKVDSICLKKALEWSNAVNASIKKLPNEEKKAFAGVKEALQKVKEEANNDFTYYDVDLPRKAMPINEALNSKKFVLENYKNLEGKISKEYIFAYPPGIPIITPGEVFDKNIINIIEKYMKANIELRSTFDKFPNIEIVHF